MQGIPMQCPQCDVELTDLANEDDHVFACPDCAGLWVDGSQLNALLLHHSLPGLDSVGGRADPDATTGTCRECGVSLTRVEQTGRSDALMFETCEDCGFVSVIEEGPVAADLAAARTSLISFFKRFSVRNGAARR
jgi:Zn-finger nucleic acid-binding protein